MELVNSEELEIELKKRLHPQALKQAIEAAVAAAGASSVLTGEPEPVALNPANEATNAFEAIGADQSAEEEFGKGAA